MKRLTVVRDSDRLIVRESQRMSLRIWTTPGFRSGSALPTSATVEWVGRAGHPSSYGLLGGGRSDSPGIKLITSTAIFSDALAGPVDEVRWGLPSEYEAAVAAVLSKEAQAVKVTKAAHGLIGSSPLVYASLTALLCRLLGAGVPRDDDEIWRLRDRCWNGA